MAIGASVGKGGVNDLADVIIVQHLLNDWLGATGQPLLPTDGDCGPRTIAAITAYQAQVVGLPKPDGLVTPGGKTWIALSTGQGSQASLSGAARTTTPTGPRLRSPPVSGLSPTLAEKPGCGRSIRRAYRPIPSMCTSPRQTPHFGRTRRFSGSRSVGPMTARTMATRTFTP